MQLTGKEKELNCCWTLLLIEQCKCNLPVQQALTLSYKRKLIWWPYKTHEVHRVGEYSEVIKVGQGGKCPKGR